MTPAAEVWDKQDAQRYQALKTRFGREILLLFQKQEILRAGHNLDIAIDNQTKE